MTRVLISAPYMLREKDKIEEMLSGCPLQIDWADVHERLEEHQLLAIIDKYEGVICGDDRFTSRVYDSAKNLKVVVKWGTGIDSLNRPEAEKRGIRLFRTPEAFTDPVADSALAYMLAHCRNVVVNDRVLKSGGWHKPPGKCLSECVVGIIGMGAIGSAVARRLVPFGPKVLGYDVVGVRSKHVAMVSLDDIFEKAGIITLHCDLNPTSHHLINRQALSRMSKRPYIINTARGPIIDENALIEALQTGIVSGAALDVFEEEPLALDSPLREMDNVLLAAHASNSSPKCWDAVHRNSINMLLEGLGVR